MKPSVTKTSNGAENLISNFYALMQGVATCLLMIKHMPWLSFTKQLESRMEVYEQAIILFPFSFIYSQEKLNYLELACPVG